MDLNLDYLVDQMWRQLRLLRVYTKKRGEYPDLEGGLIVRQGATVEHVVSVILHIKKKSNFLLIIFIFDLY